MDCYLTKGLRFRERNLAYANDMILTKFFALRSQLRIGCEIISTLVESDLSCYLLNQMCSFPSIAIS